MGPARFVQAAGFLKIPGGANPLDRTWIHPESYPLAEKILADLGFAPQVLDDKQAQEELQAKLKAVNPEELARKLGSRHSDRVRHRAIAGPPGPGSA